MMTRRPSQSPVRQNGGVPSTRGSRQDGSIPGADGTVHGPDGVFHYVHWGGSGPLAHLAHATGFCARTYSPLARRLSSEMTMVGMDDRGHGRTRARAHPRDLADWDIFAEDLSRFWDYLGGPVVAIGHSRGAVTSLMVAVRRPEQVRALILIDPTILPYWWMPGWFLAVKTGLSRFVPIAARARKRRYRWPDRDALLASYRSKPSFRSWREGFLEGYIGDGTRREGEQVVLACHPRWESRCFAVCPYDVWGYVRRVQQPVLVLYGVESDTFLAPAVKRLRRSIPHAEVRGISKTGHFLPMERPDACVAAIRTFLRKSGIL